MASKLEIPRHILITGPPGVGKTTIICKICEKLKNCGTQAKGFYTQEIRLQGKRSGFDVLTLDGKRGSLARISQMDSNPGKREYRVGQYSVDLTSFEGTALPAMVLEKDNAPAVFIIDEIGKMEMFSNAFVRAVKTLFSTENLTVVATIPIAKGRPMAFVEELRNRRDVQLFTITRDNRDEMVDAIFKAVELSYKQYGI